MFVAEKAVLLSERSQNAVHACAAVTIGQINSLAVVRHGWSSLAGHDCS